MALLSHPPAHCLGVDVAKNSLTAGDGRSSTTLANSRSAIRALLRAAKPDLVICEPTGGYEWVLLEECLKAGVACHRAEALKLKAFIRSFGTLGKSDAIDAAGMAAYGRERWRSLPLWQRPDPRERQLQALVRRRAELVALRVAERNRAKAPQAKAIAASLKAILATLERQIKALDAAIRALIAASDSLRRRAAICQSMDGIGPATAAALIALMPELGTMDRRQAASLAGTAPHPNESGLAKGRRRQRGGRPEIRTALFMPALCAAAGKGEFDTFYKRLVANGKPPMSALAAVMRKIIITLNARLRDDRISQS